MLGTCRPHFVILVTHKTAAVLRKILDPRGFDLTEPRSARIRCHTRCETHSADLTQILDDDVWWTDAQKDGRRLNLKNRTSRIPSSDG